MKIEQPDGFWKWYSLFFAIGVVACFVLAMMLIELRPAIDIEATAAEPAVAASTTATESWVAPTYYPPFNPW